MAELSDNKKIGIYIILSFLVSRFIMYTVFIVTKGAANIGSFINGMNNWDAGWYYPYIEGIVKGDLFQRINSDTGEAVWAFFPLYPLTVAIATKLTGGMISITYLGTFLSSVFFMGAEYLGSKYILLTRKSMQKAIQYVIFMSFGVYSFYFSILYTEALFLFLLSGAFYFLKKKNYIAMGICGALLSATRNIGIMFVFVVLVCLVIEFVGEGGRRFVDFVKKIIGDWKLVLGTCMIPAGLFSYMAILKCKVGDGLAFVHVERAWGRGSSFFGIFQNLKEAFWNSFPPEYLGICFVISFVLIISLIVNQNVDEAVFPLIVLLIGSSTILYAIPRFMVASLTVLIAFIDWFDKLNKRTKISICIFVFVFEIILVKYWILQSDLLI